MDIWTISRFCLVRTIPLKESLCTLLNAHMHAFVLDIPSSGIAGSSGMHMFNFRR